MTGGESDSTYLDRLPSDTTEMYSDVRCAIGTYENYGATRNATHQTNQHII